MELFGSSFRSLDLALGASGMRHEVLSNNLANVNTPGFKRSDVNFEGMLQKAIDDSANGDTSIFDDLAPTIDKPMGTTMRTDGNNVDVDFEMASLAENNVKYNALVQLAAKQMNMIEYVISDGRR